MAIRQPSPEGNRSWTEQTQCQEHGCCRRLRLVERVSSLEMETLLFLLQFLSDNRNRLIPPGGMNNNRLTPPHNATLTGLIRPRTRVEKSSLGLLAPQSCAMAQPMGSKLGARIRRPGPAWPPAAALRAAIQAAPVARQERLCGGCAPPFFSLCIYMGEMPFFTLWDSLRAERSTRQLTDLPVLI